MDIFPTQYSTLSSVALNHFLAARYGFENTCCRLLIHNVSDTYLLEDGSGKYIFKIYRNAHRKLDEIKGEAELLNILADRGAKVSHPLKDLKGDVIQSFNAAEGTRYGILFTYAIGKVVLDMNAEQLAILGREMAALHNITANIQLSHKRITFNADTTIAGPVRTVKNAFDELPDEYAWLNEMANVVIEKLGKFDYANFSYGYCHYDFLPKNFHFDAGNNITFFDFDFVGKGYLANDITTLYIHYFMEASSGKITREAADASFAVFVEQYRKVRPLHDDELKAIPYLGFAFWVFYLGFQYENFDDWSSMFFGNRFLKDRVALMKRWMEWFQK
jgi:Ser/Thr protein kinase RdoA (MazF antagonist)